MTKLDKKGFTLIEVLMVVAIIGIISSIIFVGLGGTTEKADVARGLSFSHTLIHDLGSEAMGIWGFEEGTGDQLKDRSGYDNHGTWFGSGSHWATNDDIAQLGSVGQFNGSSDYIAIDNLFYNQPGQIEKITIEAWFKTIDDRAGMVDWDRSEYFSLGIAFDTTQTSGKISWDTTGENEGTHDMESNIYVNNNVWHHVAATFDSSTGIKTIYLDGQLDNYEKAYTPGEKLGTGSTRYGFIGDGSEATSFNGSRNQYYFSGFIDEVRIYYQVLSAVQIEEHYTEGLKRLGLKEG